MRLLPFGSFLVLVPVLLSAAACDGDVTRNPSPDEASAGQESGGTHSAGSSTGGSKPAGGSGAGGSTAEAGEPAVSEGGAGGQPSGGEAGAGGADSSEECGDPTGLSILGDYVDPNGERWWLRDSGKAVTLVHVPAGAPRVSKPPALWQVVQACSGSSVLLLQSPNGTYTRLDYLAGAKSLTFCLASSSVATLPLAAVLPAADRVNTIDSGCNAGPWTRVVKGEK